MSIFSHHHTITSLSPGDLGKRIEAARRDNTAQEKILADSGESVVSLVALGDTVYVRKELKDCNTSTTRIGQGLQVAAADLRSRLSRGDFNTVVRAPNIFDEYTHDGHRVILMEHCPYPTLQEVLSHQALEGPGRDECLRSFLATVPQVSADRLQIKSNALMRACGEIESMTPNLTHFLVERIGAPGENGAFTLHLVLVDLR